VALRGVDIRKMEERVRFLFEYGEAMQAGQPDRIFRGGQLRGGSSDYSEFFFPERRPARPPEPATQQEKEALKTEKFHEAVRFWGNIALMAGTRDPMKVREFFEKNVRPMVGANPKFIKFAVTAQPSTFAAEFQEKLRRTVTERVQQVGKAAGSRPAVPGPRSFALRPAKAARFAVATSTLNIFRRRK
jgi:hypothetical protein